MKTKICSNIKCLQREKFLSEFDKNSNTKDGLAYICKICKKSYNHKYQKENKKDLKKQRNIYEQKRKLNDIDYKLKSNLRSRLSKALKYNWKSGRTIELLGCTIKELKKHLESQFIYGMNWDNYGAWHIDHRIPCALFDLSKESEQRKCFNFSNLQPLWAIENIRKNKFLK